MQACTHNDREDGRGDRYIRYLFTGYRTLCWTLFIVHNFRESAFRFPQYFYYVKELLLSAT